MHKKLTVKKNKAPSIKMKFLVLSAALLGGTLWSPSTTVTAESCPDLKIIFARGSGAEWKTSADYIDFRDRIDEKIASTGLNYEFMDLEYPAVGVGAEHLGTTVGAYFSGGDAYEFGASVNEGVENLKNIIKDTSCTNTKYVFGGYSQGAVVLLKSLEDFNPEQVIYIATFGDPKIYLPEGEGIIPTACYGKNLSDYRMYVPDCQAYKGILGAYIPYEPEAYAGKMGTWCNGRDVLCSSHWSVHDHTSYVEDGLYEDASRVIASKVTQAFGITNEYTSPHDTAILIDSTGSMAWLIDQFKEEATRLADETFAAGGRVALYDYRDLSDPYEPVARCDFETCTAENFAGYLDEIVVGGGGDEPESLLSASVTAMNELKWRRGATKSMVVLTDAPYLSPDIDATTVEDVVALSKEIDPVNMYIITEKRTATEYPEMAELAESTGGFLTSSLGELNLVTDYIMERYDTLPRVEEMIDESEMPEISATTLIDEEKEITIKIDRKTATGAIVILNEAVLGVVEGEELKLGNLDRSIPNTLVLVPINESRRGEPVEIELPVIKITVRETEMSLEVKENIEIEAVQDAAASPEVEEVIEIEKMAKIDNEVVPVTAENDLNKEVKVLISNTSDEMDTTKEMAMVPKAPDTGVAK